MVRQYEITLYDKVTDTTNQIEAIRKMMIMLILTNTGDTFEIKKVKKVI